MKHRQSIVSGSSVVLLFSLLLSPMASLSPATAASLLHVLGQVFPQALPHAQALLDNGREANVAEEADAVAEATPTIAPNTDATALPAVPYCERAAVDVDYPAPHAFAQGWRLQNSAFPTPRLLAPAPPRAPPA